MVDWHKFFEICRKNVLEHVEHSIKHDMEMHLGSIYSQWRPVTSSDLKDCYKYSVEDLMTTGLNKNAPKVIKWVAGLLRG